jgi:ssDNA-binding Zn-finger/Zn-ribbon topoisomerase 1
MGLLIGKSNDKNQTIVTINNLGIYYQELRLKDRPMSPRTKIGKLAIVDGSVMASYDEYNKLEALICDRNSLEKQLKVAGDLVSSAANDTEKKQRVKLLLVKKLENVKQAIADCPISKLQSLDAKAFVAIDALVDKARARHQQGKANGGEFVGFTHYPTREYFYEQEARSLLKKHNEALVNKAMEDGFMDFDAAMAIVCRRFAKSDEIRKKANAANPLFKK